MNSLRQLSSPTALVIRNGESVTVLSKHLVPGDVVLLNAGDMCVFFRLRSSTVRVELTFDQVALPIYVSFRYRISRWRSNSLRENHCQVLHVPVMHST